MAKATKSPTATSPSSTEAERLDDASYRDRVAMRAYELYLARGGTDGADFDDWLAAERELAASNGKDTGGDPGE
jgi:hypothetical protein